MGVGGTTRIPRIAVVRSRAKAARMHVLKCCFMGPVEGQVQEAGGREGGCRLCGEFALVTLSI